MLYDLMKLAYSLDRDKKEYLYENYNVILKQALSNELDTIIESFKKKKKPIVIPVEDDNKIKPDDEPKKILYNDESWDSAPVSHYGTSEIKSLIKTSNLHDPETSEQLLKLVELMEKHIGIEEDISYDNISVFIHPLLNGARKLILKQFKLMGLTRRLHNLSKKYKKYKNSKVSKTEINKLKKEFKTHLKSLKERLNSFECDMPKLKKIENSILKSASINNAQLITLIEQYVNNNESLGKDREKLFEILSGGGIDASPDDIIEAIDVVLRPKEM